eukprot:14295797-Alexandrium_andersonii.AAC.1
MRRRRRASCGASCAWQCSRGGLRLSLMRSRGEGHLARWARWDCRSLGLDFGPRAHFDQTPK